jgi:predicted alpha-1,2-mannosidase
MKQSFILFTCALLFISNLFSQQKNNINLSKYVDPFIGTQGGGNTFPGASYPFGMVKLGPDCGDLQSNMGYLKDGKIRGFSHLHVSGTGGGPKYGNILVYPFMGDVRETGYGSERGKETAKAGYFSAELTEGNIKAELTCTHKTGIHRYTFKNSGKAGILIDAGSFLGKATCCFENQNLVGSEIKVISNTEISGYNRISGGWNAGSPFSVYFYAIFNTPAETFGTWKSGNKHANNKTEFDSGEPVGAWFVYNNNSQKQIEVRVGISFVSEEKAKENCKKEAVGVTFEQALENAKAAWDNYLQRVEVESENTIERTKFYTALYHTLLQPSDRTGENAGWQNTIPYYDDFYCIWDTYRTNHPLYKIIAPEKETAIINALIDIYEHEGYMPDGRSGNSNGRTQGGSNADMVVAEAILKNLKGIDYEKCYEAMLKNAEVQPGGNERKEGRGGLADYNNIGYVSTNYERAGTRTVEYAANDWAIAECALKLGKKSDYEKYSKRAQNWMNLWKPIESEGAKGFIMPRKANGDWDEDYTEATFDYVADINPNLVGLNPVPDKYKTKTKFTVLTGGSWPNFFYESHSWEYSLYVPHDVKQLIVKCGGQDAFVARLDTFFKKNYYSIANEPGFLAPALYIYAGCNDKTILQVNGLLKKHYSEKADGIPGNDDSGAMSSWYAFNTIGFFPNAGQDVYLIGSPHFKKVTIMLGAEGKKLLVMADNLSDKNIFIKAAELNGKPLNQAWMRHGDIENGGILKFTMTDKPTGWGKNNLPPSQSDSK